jgi:hypothetical protein
MEIELYFWGEILITLFEDDNELKHTLIISICHRGYAFFLDSINPKIEFQGNEIG